MRWQRGPRSDDLQDRRGASGPGLGGMRLPIGRGGGIGGVIVLLVLALLGGTKVIGGGGGEGFDVGGSIFDQLQPVEEPSGAPLPGAPDPQAELVDFVSFVLNDVQTTFADIFRRGGQQYVDAKLVLFTSAVRSGCGAASRDTGPFYCSLDRTAYLDLDFFRELARRFQAPGDFAQAYVIAHEIGHHVQELLGVSNRVRALAEDRPDDANELSVRQELQADCLAGVWAHSTYQRGILEDGDIEEGLTAAAAIGDDRIQGQTSGRINPETWTHGSAEQRTAWLTRGFRSGDPDSCDTFNADI